MRERVIEKHENVTEQLKEASKIFSVPPEQLSKTLQRFLKEIKKKEKTRVQNLVDACKHLFSEWKNIQKKKKTVTSDEIERLKNKAEMINGTEIKVITGTTIYESTATAGSITKEPNYVVHIFDGSKITSAASGNVAINLQEIAPKLGRILGGSGGGKPKLTQSGGLKKEKIKEALKMAKKLTKKKLEKQ